MRLSYHFVIVWLSLLLFTGCTHTLPSPMRHAQHTAYQISHIHFDPNTRIHVNSTTKLLLPEFEKIYELGQKDRVQGLSRDEAQQRVNSMLAPDFLPESSMKMKFFSQQYSVDNPEESRRIHIDGLTKTYWDGFEGRQ